MKKLTALMLAALMLAALISAFTSCGELESPPAYMPAVRYENVPLENLTLMIQWGSGPADGGGPAFGMTAGEALKANAAGIPYAVIGDGDLKIVNGSDKNARFDTKFEGVFTKDGELTDHKESDLSSLPSGKYVVAFSVTKQMKDRDEEYYVFTGIEK